MYFDRPGQLFAVGHNSAGVTAPQMRWFFAEGATGAYCDECLLIANPAPTGADVRVSYLPPTGGMLGKAYKEARSHSMHQWNRP